MEDLQIISQLKTLKNVSPRKEWVILAKAQLFENAADAAPAKASFVGIWQQAAGVIFRKELAYSLAALLLVIGGAYGFMNFPIPSMTNPAKNAAALSVVESNLKSNVEVLKAKSQDLSSASQQKSTKTAVALSEVKAAAKTITETIKKDPQLASSIALDINNNKVFLDIAGGNASSEISDMYKTIATQMIKDLDGTTLNEDQAKELDRIKASLHANADYATALRDILLISRVNSK